MSTHSLTRRAVPGNSGKREDGYILLTLLLIIALAIIFTAAIVPSITFEIKRDREEEMIHRGTQYSRAVRTYFKKFGRYPTKIEDLENTNNLRFLRKRYKDPLTGKDFKLLHFSEVQLTMGGAIGGAGINGATAPNGASPFGPAPPPPPPQGGAFGNTGSAFGGSQSSFGGNSNSGFGSNGSTPQDPNQAQNQNGNSNGSSEPSDPSQPQQEGSTTGNSGDKLAAIGGGPIVGVGSTSKKETIREFNHKKKYNEWQFIYDPATDRGGLITTPNQPALAGFGQQGVQNLNGQTGASTPNSGGFGGGITGTQPQGFQTQGATGGASEPSPPSTPSTPPPQ